MTQEKFNEKMDELVSLLNYDGKTEEEIKELKNVSRRDSEEENPNRKYFYRVETLVDELDFSHAELYEYIKICDFDRLMV